MFRNNIIMFITFSSVNVSSRISYFYHFIAFYIYHILLLMTQDSWYYCSNSIKKGRLSLNLILCQFSSYFSMFISISLFLKVNNSLMKNILFLETGFKLIRIIDLHNDVFLLRAYLKNVISVMVTTLISNNMILISLSYTYDLIRAFVLSNICSPTPLTKTVMLCFCVDKTLVITTISIKLVFTNKIYMFLNKMFLLCLQIV